MTDIHAEALEALTAKQGAERQLADMAMCPPWRHAAFAGLEAGLVVSPAVPLVLRFVILLAVLFGMGFIVRSDRRRLGVFINGYRRGRTRMVALPLLLLLLGIYGLSVYLGLSRGLPLASVALAGLAFVVAYQGSVIWQRVFVRELGA
ncbi:hypothetical protein HMF7854_03100 [Sphingomonas ginkgonis]|uniref:Uncharacterized protein n=1 Tax=Sphingomonas ginkgonis TaxID=2315330 RepID=A0A429V7P7_9SPHN|nr:hypothetical protein [Sphingomonas ginkgonis]RST29922.1 hypothetical protein HMF7854_03100 [Sphingomonas ginkgonis]